MQKEIMYLFTPSICCDPGACNSFSLKLDSLVGTFERCLDRAKSGKLNAIDGRNAMPISAGISNSNEKSIRLKLTDQDFGYGYYINAEGCEYLIYQYPIIDTSTSAKTMVKKYSNVEKTLENIYDSVSRIVSLFSRYERESVKLDDSQYLKLIGLNIRHGETFDCYYKSLKNLGKTKKVMLAEINVENPSKMIFGHVGYNVLKMPPCGKLGDKSSQRNWQLFKRTLECLQEAYKIPLDMAKAEQYVNKPKKIINWRNVLKKYVVQLS